MSLGKVVTGFIFGEISSKVQNLLHFYPPTEVVFDPKRIDSSLVNDIQRSVWNPVM